MKNINYILSFAGWAGWIITLFVVIIFNTCSDKPGQIINEKTEIHNYYDSSEKPVPFKYVVPGEPIFIPVPADVDTFQILANYFAKYPYSRVFGNDTVTITLLDTLSKNNFFHPGKAYYKWHIPMLTVESKTTTIEAEKKIQVLAGGHVAFNKNYLQEWGPDIYLQTKRGQLFGVGYEVRQQAISIKAAINLNDAFRSKNNRKEK